MRVLHVDSLKGFFLDLTVLLSSGIIAPVRVRDRQSADSRWSSSKAAGAVAYAASFELPHERTAERKS